MDDVERLVARAAIEDCLKHYARGIDRKDWPMVRACFHDDAVDHHGDFAGTADDFIAWVRDRHAEVPFSMHYLLNCLIEFHGAEVAQAETYFWALQRKDLGRAAHGEGEHDLEVFGRYIDRFEKRDGTWRIAGRKVAYDSTRTQPSTHHLRALVGVLGRRDGRDPVYEMAAE